MEDNDVGIYKGKYYKAVEFKAIKEGDIACKHCAFVLGQCRPAIMALGQCYIGVSPAFPTKPTLRKKVG